VKKPETPRNSEHCSDLLLPYVDGLLGPSQKHAVEAHLQQCQQCSSEEEEVRETTALLRGHQEAFCPEPWELYEFLHYGRDADGTVRNHLDGCRCCQEVCRDFAPTSVAEQMPANVRVRLDGGLPAQSDANSPATVPRETVLDRLSQWFRFPAVAVGVAAVALLAVVLLRSPDMPQSMIALSSVTWDGAPKPKAIQAAGGRAAIALVLKNFDPPLSHKQVDSLYRALAPTMPIYERFSMVPPDAFRDAIDSRDRELTDTRQLVERVGKKLSLTACLVVTLTSRSGSVDMKLDLVDISAGRITDSTTIDHVPIGDWESTMRESALVMLQSQGTRP
jgi:hypothetical protein